MKWVITHKGKNMLPIKRQTDGNKLQWNLNRSTIRYIQVNAFHIWPMSVILFRSRFVTLENETYVCRGLRSYLWYYNTLMLCMNVRVLINGNYFCHLNVSINQTVLMLWLSKYRPVFKAQMTDKTIAWLNVIGREFGFIMISDAVIQLYQRPKRGH